jgi:excisionase family DNA binding protein
VPPFVVGADQLYTGWRSFMMSVHLKEPAQLLDPPQPKLTPPQVAERYGISADKVLGWIHSGELRAINVAAKVSGRPRYRIDVADLLVFEQKRAAVPTTLSKGQRRRKPQADVIAFF